MKQLARTMSDFEPFSSAESLLLNFSRSGTIAGIASSRPDNCPDKNKVRASFLRFLLLGNDDHCVVHERGVHVEGAYITETLDLQATSLQRPITIKNCCFAQQPDLSDANIMHSLSFNGSSTPGLNCSRLRIGGSFFLERIRIRIGNSSHLTEVFYPTP